MGALIVVLIAVALVAAAIYFRSLQLKAMRQFAVQHGLQFTARGWAPANANDFELFRRGTTRRWNDVMTGMWGACPITYSDYQYTQYSGQSSSTYLFSVVLMPLGCTIPQVTVKSRTLIGRLAEDTVGAPGIRFESDAFNTRFNVHCSSQDLAVELIDARMIEALLGAERGLCVAFGPDEILVWTKRHSTQSLPALLDFAVTLPATVPGLVLRQSAPPPPPTP